MFELVFFTVLYLIILILKVIVLSFLSIYILIAIWDIITSDSSMKRDDKYNHYQIDK